MTTPRVKRPFARAGYDPQGQTQITAFFSTDGWPSSVNGYSNNSSSASAFVSTSSTSSTPVSLSAPLPLAVQANLLSVGMRIRKSVPEGYKTGGKAASSATAAGTSAPAATAQPEAASLPIAIPSSTSSSASASFSSPYSRLAPPPPPPTYRELQPFCGIHKVGGLAVQPAASHGSFPANEDSADPEQPLFPATLFRGFVESDGSGGSRSDSWSSSGSDAAESLDPPSLTTSQETATSSSPLPLPTQSPSGAYADVFACTLGASLTYRPSDMPTEAVASARKRQWHSIEQDGDQTLDGDFDMILEPDIKMLGVHENEHDICKAAEQQDDLHMHTLEHAYDRRGRPW